MGNLFAHLTLTAALVAAIPVSTFASSKDDLSSFLKAFHANPKKVLFQPVQKYDADTGRPIKEKSLFSDEAIASGEFVNQKDEIRKEIGCRVDEKGVRFCLKDYIPGKTPFAGNDTVDMFMRSSDINIVRSVKGLEQLGLRTANVNIPWSDSYWPMAKGMIAARYADGGFPRSRDWTANYGYFLARPPSAMPRDIMAPAEKYDLIMGDSSYTLTHAVWNKVAGYAASTGKPIPGWAGICHGWSPASITFSEPVRKISVRTANGETVTMYPHDIKALAAGIWATLAGENVNFIGKSCTKGTGRDEYGRVTNPDCGDTNPGTWHQVVTNQLGIIRKGFIMDATWDAQVWNHPVYKYEITYFNPQTLQTTNIWKQAVVKAKDYTIDKFRPHRSVKATQFIGVSMNVYYVSEVGASHAEGGRANKKMVRYVYDLELDDDSNILGGEWYTVMHPDWLWKPRYPRVLSVVEPRVTTAWTDIGQSVPREWQMLAPTASRYAQPMASVVEKLVELSSAPAQ